MTPSAASRNRQRTGRPSWSGLAVVVEAMVLLLALVGSLAVLTQLFAAASVRAQEGRQLALAVSCATNAAERFAANPAEAEGATEQDGMTTTCMVTEHPTAQGTPYQANITVQDATGSEPLYTLTTSRYEREVE